MIFSSSLQTIIMRRKTLSYLLFIPVLVIVFMACQKENNQGKTHLTIHLTDNPYNATEVNVDIREVRVNFANDSAGWFMLPTHAGIYNLLALQNGVDTVLAQGPVPVGSLKEVRFVLGNNNSIKIDSVLYPLTIPSGSESGLKIKVDKHLNAQLDSLIIDFDAALSILQTGNGEYKLKPVLKIK